MTWLIILLAIVLVKAKGAQSPAPVISHPPGGLNVGGKSPLNIWCFWDEWPGGRYCQYKYFMIRRNPTGNIDYISYAPGLHDENISAGDMVNLWGPPDSYDDRYYFYKIFWKDRSMYAGTKDNGLTVWSKVYILAWGIPEETEGVQLPWKGWMPK